LLEIPSWRQAGALNVPAVVALLASVAFGVIRLASLPGRLEYGGDHSELDLATCQDLSATLTRT
jgi:hypothetical protein